MLVTPFQGGGVVSEPFQGLRAMLFVVKTFFTERYQHILYTYYST